MKPENDADYQKFLKAQVRGKALKDLIQAAHSYCGTSVLPGVGLAIAAHRFVEADYEFKTSMKINLDKQTEPVVGSTTDAQSESRKPVWPEPGAPARAAKPPLGDIRPPADTCAAVDYESADYCEFGNTTHRPTHGPAWESTGSGIGSIGGFANKHVEATHKFPQPQSGIAGIAGRSKNWIRNVFSQITQDISIEFQSNSKSVLGRTVAVQNGPILVDVKLMGWVCNIPDYFQKHWSSEAKAYLDRLNGRMVKADGRVLYGSVANSTTTGNGYFLFFNESDICPHCVEIVTNGTGKL